MSDKKAHIYVNGIPEGHIIAGYVAVVKVIDEEGGAYWATRTKDLNDMEGFGMMMNATEMFREDLRAGRIKEVGGDD